MSLGLGLGRGLERPGLSCTLRTPHPAFTTGLGPQRGASQPAFRVAALNGRHRGRSEAEGKPRSSWLWHPAACAARDRAGVSEFPWEQAEASKQLGEKVTLLLASLPGGLARCPLPTHPGVPSGPGLQPQLPVYSCVGQGRGMIDGGRNGDLAIQGSDHITSPLSNLSVGMAFKGPHSVAPASQLLLVLSTPRPFWTFPYLPSSFLPPEIPFLTLSAFQTAPHPSGSSSSNPS